MRAVVVIPAYDAAASIADTVRAATAIEDVASVIVVDDGSSDDTALRAREAGATVVKLDRNRGKGAALNEGVRHLPAEADAVLLLDADLGETASHAALLLEPLHDGSAQLVIAVLPSPPGSGGFGLVKALARWGIARLCGFEAQAPLSGQRALTTEALSAVLPFASGFGVEVAMTVRAAWAGLAIREVPAPMSHAATGRDIPGFLHRGRQFADVARALAGLALARTLRRR